MVLLLIYMQDFHSFMHVVSYVHLLVLLCRTWTVKNFFFKFEKSVYCFEILFNQTLIKSLGGTKIFSFNEVFNSLSLCFVYLVLFYKPFQTFIYIYIYTHKNLQINFRYVAPLRPSSPEVYYIYMKNKQHDVTTS